MNRVTTAEVLEIMDTTLTEIQLTPYITGANVFVTASLATALGTEVLKEVERWLSAHMAAVAKERVSKEAGAGGAYIKYAGTWGEDLSSTHYGQMVLMLDSSNTLRNLKVGRKQAWIKAVVGE